MSPMGGNVGDDKVISTTMEAGSGDIRYGKYLQVSRGIEGRCVSV